MTSTVASRPSTVGACSPSSEVPLVVPQNSERTGRAPTGAPRALAAVTEQAIDELLDALAAVRLETSAPSAPSVGVVAGPVLLIDLDNIGLPSPDLADAVLEKIAATAGPHAVAVAVGRDHAFDLFSGPARGAGMRVLLAPPLRNGADQVLLGVAQHAATLGVTTFTLVSGDHCFSALPGQVTVVMPQGRSVARSLAAHAVEVRYVELPRSTRNARSRGSRSARRRAARGRRDLA